MALDGLVLPENVAWGIVLVMRKEWLGFEGMAEGSLGHFLRTFGDLLFFHLRFFFLNKRHS